MSACGRLFVLSGPSGSGKSTVIDRVLERLAVPLEVPASATTRPPRADDAHTKRYIHMSEAEFDESRRSGKFVECARVSGHWYGTPRGPVEQAIAAGRSVLLEIDVQGGMAVKKIYPDCVMIFLKAGPLEEYERRLRNRGTNSEEEIQRRLAAARRELEMAAEYDYEIVNDDLENTVAELRQIFERFGGTACA